MVLIHAPRNSAFGGSTDSLETETAEAEAEADADADEDEDEDDADEDEDEEAVETAEDEEANAGNKVISESKIVIIKLLPFINITLLCSKT